METLGQQGCDKVHHVFCRCFYYYLIFKLSLNIVRCSQGTWPSNLFVATTVFSEKSAAVFSEALQLG